MKKGIAALLLSMIALAGFAQEKKLSVVWDLSSADTTVSPITLTPGTVTVEVEGSTLKVHALVRENASAESFAPMDRKAALAADGKPRERRDGGT